MGCNSVKGENENVCTPLPPANPCGLREMVDGGRWLTAQAKDGSNWGGGGGVPPPPPLM